MSSTPDSSNSEQSSGTISSSPELEANSPPSCRICLQATPKELITPCECSGSQGFVHFECLSKWIESSRRIRCSVCNSTYSGIRIQQLPLGFSQYITSHPEVALKLGAFTVLVAFLIHIDLISFMVVSLATGSDKVLKMFRAIASFGAFAIFGTILSLTWAVTSLTFQGYKEWTLHNFAYKVFEVEPNDDSWWSRVKSNLKSPLPSVNPV
ncbi:E3 ubiquitin-protein ligase MARCHF2 [Halotydeus destructor]|nr:E3 ubiquitin-protein ligase MARCHF2 [Halotydeus destructor]